MTLKKTDREEVVKFRLEKARNTLAEVPVLIENKFYRTAANRLYYVCFYAVTALLINDAFETHTHSGVKTLFGLHYIKGNIIEKSFGKMYQKLFNLRQDGDYEDWFEIDKEDIIPNLAPVEKFIEAIENLINNKNM